MSLIDQLTASPEGERRMAAARLRYSILKLMHDALDDSEMTKSSLAAALGIRKSAVTQVFRGDGNVRINTLAEYLAALGRELEVSLVPAGTLRDRALQPRFAGAWEETGATVLEMSGHPAVRRRAFRRDFEAA